MKFIYYYVASDVCGRAVRAPSKSVRYFFGVALISKTNLPPPMISP
jgi:hypothetical protein